MTDGESLDWARLVISAAVDLLEQFKVLRSALAQAERNLSAEGITALQDCSDVPLYFDATWRRLQHILADEPEDLFGISERLQWANRDHLEPFISPNGFLNCPIRSAVEWARELRDCLGAIRDWDDSPPIWTFSYFDDRLASLRSMARRCKAARKSVGRIEIEALERLYAAVDAWEMRLSEASAVDAKPFTQYVSLQQMAEYCKVSKRTVERWKTGGKLPFPDIEGGGGRADNWKWEAVRPTLEQLTGRVMPERFPDWNGS